MTIQTSDTIAELAEALSRFQEKMQTLPQSKKGYNYRYTPLDVVIEAIRQPMADNGLCFVQMPTAPQNEGVALTTRLMHI